MHPNEQSQSPHTDGFKMTANFLTFVARSISTTVEVFLHTGFGSKYLHLQGAAALVILMLYTGLWPGHSPYPMLIFFWLYVIKCFRARMESARQASRGELVHSLYSGLPRLCRRFPRLNELTVKSKIEPVLVTVVGLLLMPLSAPLGVYLFYAGIVLGLSVNAAVAYDKAKDQQAIDSILEARRHAESVRVRVTACERV